MFVFVFLFSCFVGEERWEYLSADKSVYGWSGFNLDELESRCVGDRIDTSEGTVALKKNPLPFEMVYLVDYPCSCCFTADQLGMDGWELISLDSKRKTFYFKRKL